MNTSARLDLGTDRQPASKRAARLARSAGSACSRLASCGGHGEWRLRSRTFWPA